MTGEFRLFEESEAKQGLLGAILESKAPSMPVFCFQRQSPNWFKPINNTEWKNINTLVLVDQRTE